MCEFRANARNFGEHLGPSRTRIRYNAKLQGVGEPTIDLAFSFASPEYPASRTSSLLIVSITCSYLRFTARSPSRQFALDMIGLTASAINAWAAALSAS